MARFAKNDPRKELLFHRVGVDGKLFRVFGVWATDDFRTKDPSGAKADTKSTLGEALNRLTPALRDAIRSIAIIPESDPNCEKHFGYIDGDKNRPVVGHCHIDTGHICLKLPEMNVWGLAHEAAHALTFALRKNNERRFEDGWRDIAKCDYGEDQFPEDQQFPYLGFLDRYSAQDVLEHIAVFVEMTIRAALNIEHPFAGVPKTDQRYFWHAELLRQHGFISKEDFDRIAPFLR